MAREPVDCPGGTASRWIDILRPHLRDSGAAGGPSSDLVKFATTFTMNKLLKPFYAQVLWALRICVRSDFGENPTGEGGAERVYQKSFVPERDGLGREGAG